MNFRDFTLITENGTKITAAIEPKLTYKDYSRYYKADHDVELDRIFYHILNSRYGIGTATMNDIPEIKNVIFNPPATIVFWQDGTKTVVKATNEIYDPEKGLAMAIAKRALGNQGNYYNVIKKWVGTTKSCDSCKYCDACCTEDPCWDCDDHFCYWVDKNNTED